jgi:acetoin utilization deacetylase AcuC-like enzyme
MTLIVTQTSVVWHGFVSRTRPSQGDGTAAILSGEPRAFTLSVHCEANFPHRKTCSDLDVGLPRGVTDAAYLRVVADNLRAVLQSFRPDLVLYDAGVDVHRSDALGFLELSDQGIYDRELLVRAESFVVPLSATHPR